MGVDHKSTLWYLPEGYTGSDFDTYVLVQNPNSTAAQATFTFYTNPGPAGAANYAPGPEVPEGMVQVTAEIGPWSRYTVRLDDVAGLESRDVATRVDSDIPVVAERSMYFNYEGADDGHLSVGASETHSFWHLAEGYTGAGFDTYVLFMNPYSNWQRVTATFMTPEGEPVVKEYDVAPYSRYTVHVDEIEGLAETDVSTMLAAAPIADPGAGTANMPGEGGEPCGQSGIIAERAMYFVYGGIPGGSCSIGFGL
jgi:hypothetical protein